MAIETETKLKISKKEFNCLKKILGKPKFFLQKNVIYRFKEGMFRIREENGKRIVTYKGKRKKSKFKSRKEIEFETDSNTNTLKSFLESFVFSKPFVYSKKRANFKHGECTVSLDILNIRDYFIEVEGREKDIERCLKELGLEKKKIEKRAYQDILHNINS